MQDVCVLDRDMPSPELDFVSWHTLVSQRTGEFTHRTRCGAHRAEELVLVMLLIIVLMSIKATRSTYDTYTV